MMNLFPDYQILETLQANAQKVIYRAVRKADRLPVIVKALKAEYPSPDEIARIQHEYQIAKNLELEGVVKVLSLEKEGNRYALIMEDMGGISLAHLLEKKRFPLAEALQMALQTVRALAQLHEHQIIHKDIKPSNLIVKPKTGQIKIADFSIATRLVRETQLPDKISALEGTLAYMSPEQTGRMNRALDYRSDFYSFGVTLYEMLTGQLPFVIEDPLELIHYHLAIAPVPPHESNSAIPEQISAIILKLLEKNAEDRYQSAYGIESDLEKCLKQWQRTGSVEPFALAQQDRSAQFLVSQTLYGRGEAIASLLDAFKRVATPSGEKSAKGENRGSVGAEFVMVTGYSGVGKTSVINEIHKPIVEKRGYFIAGKFDLLKRDIPYSAWVQALRSLVEQILVEPPERVACWKEKLMERLGDNGQLMVNVLPEIELIIGRQPPLLELGPIESQNRFNRIFQEFMSVFARAEHPLTIFLDDLQWADASSLKLIELVANDRDRQCLLFVGAYRDNEVGAAHSLTAALERMQQEGVTLNNIVLQPLDFNCVSHLIADTLHTELEQGEPEQHKRLAELLFHQTGGNPFFLVQLLQTLYAEGLFAFNFSQGCWLWDIEEIQGHHLSNYDAVELVARNLQKLSLTAQQVLQLAACMGNCFNLDLLAAIYGETRSQIQGILWEALQAGFIVPTSDPSKLPLLTQQPEEVSTHRRAIAYKFLHDRVQQAAYFLIPEEQKQETHLKIGRLLLHHIPPHRLEENIFDLVNQLNLGVALITAPTEQIRLAELNLMAGRKAKAASAHEVAREYFNAGLPLLNLSSSSLHSSQRNQETLSWQSHYDLTYNLHIEALESAYTTAEFEQFLQLSEVVLSRAKTLLEKIKVYELKISFYFSSNQMQESLNTGLETLDLLGLCLPRNPNKLQIGLKFLQMTWLKGRRRIEDLADLPEMTDPYKIVIIRILKSISPVTFVTQPNLYPLVICSIVNLSVKYGNSPASCIGYGCLGIIYCGLLENIDNGYRYGQLGLKVLERFQDKENKSFSYVIFNTFVRHWKEPIRANLGAFLEGLQSGQETGDIEQACHCANFYCGYLFLSGESLEFVNQKHTEYIELIANYKQEFQLHQTKTWNQAALILQDSLSKALQVTNEQSCWKEANNEMGSFVICVAKILLFYLFKNSECATEQTALAEKYERSGMATMYVPAYKFYYSLVLLSVYPNVSPRRKNEYLKKVKTHQKKMKHWAKHCPENYLHKYELVEAEKARVLGENEKAALYYDRAIKGAKKNKYLQEEALANELAAEFYFSRGREKLARLYLTDAYYGYLRWGAKAKVEDLRTRYSQYFFDLRLDDPSEADALLVRRKTTSSATSKAGLQSLDLATVMKASQAISGEIVLDKLLERLMQIAIENAGAQKGMLFLKQEDTLILAAKAVITPQKKIELPFISITEEQDVPLSLLNYLQRTKETVVINNATQEGLFIKDPYIIQHQPQSVLGFPIIHQGKLTGILYLENRLTRGAFTYERLEVLSLLAAQASISIENSLLYTSLEEKVKVRTQEINEKNSRLEQTLDELKKTQLQLIQSEKMSSLGQLVAGVAHEINNPVSFIYGNIRHAEGYIQDLFDLLNLYQKYYPDQVPEIQDKIDSIDLEFIARDLPKIQKSMKVGTSRIQKIVESLRSFSRLDEASLKYVNIHEGIDNALEILQNRLRVTSNRPEIEVMKHYGQLPHIECYAGALNQVFMNILNNAIDAIEMAKSQSSTPCIQIWTEVVNNNEVKIRIADNGVGMTEEIASRVFDPFFTTKPVGQGTGMGMALSYQIVVDQHHGQLECVSRLSEGTEFVVQIPMRQI
jgi:predicted ATPase/signal transduction histidine kinase/tRNA A-37 threonylcarbamoyl transferase component Bud32